MDQVYFVSRPNEDGRRPVLYRYGNFVYSDVLRVAGCEDMRKLPKVMQYLQSIQGEMPFFSEYAAIPMTSPHATSLGYLNEAVDFFFSEMLGADGALHMLAKSGEAWLDGEGTNVYFALETVGDYNANNADVIFCKTFRQDVMLTVIFFDGTYYATLTDASEEQALVDTLFPNIFGKQRGMHLRTYKHPKFKKLAVWEATDPFPDPSAADDPETASAAFATTAVDTTWLNEDAGVENLAGEGYTQTYIVRRPQHLREGSYRRSVLFRFGGWCYGGEVDFGVDALHLGDVPEVLPALQKQQGNLAFICEASAVPSSNEFAPILRAFAAGVNFFQKEMLASEAELERLTELGETAWINEDWAASFFEMQFHPSEAMRSVEVIASKCYFRGGVILHTVMFGGSIYAVLADANDDQPLLDVAFPDVTARCRGVQVRAYEPTDADAGLPLRPRRMLVWEGRRKGSSGVGWGTGALVSGDMGAEIRAAARDKAERDAEATAEAAAAATGHARSHKFATDATTSSAAAGSASDGKDAGDGDADGKEDVGETAPVASSSSAGGKMAEPEDDAPEPSSSKLDDDDGGAGAGAGGGSGSGSGSGAGSGRGPDPLVATAVRAPHHLPPMGGGGGSRLKALPVLGGAAPWDKTGRPVLGGGKK